MLLCYLGHNSCFYPLRKVVYYFKDKLCLSSGGWEQSNDIQSPSSKGIGLRIRVRVMEGCLCIVSLHYHTKAFPSSFKVSQYYFGWIILNAKDFPLILQIPSCVSWALIYIVKEGCQRISYKRSL